MSPLLKVIGCVTVISMSAAVYATIANAQTTGGVFGPAVNEGDRSMSYRAAYAPGDNGARDGFATRLHYQHSLNDSFRLRGLIQGSNKRSGDLKLDAVKAELQWQFLEKTPSGFSSALRFDAAVPTFDGGNTSLGLHSTNQLDLDNGWKLNAVGLFSKRVGNGAPNGINVEARASVTKKLDNGLSVSVRSFNSFGNTYNGFGGFHNQKHRIGPAVSGKFDDKWGWKAGALFGVSKSAPDTDAHIWITRKF